MEQLGFGRFESVPIDRGEVVLDPWPMTVQRVNLGGGRSASPAPKGVCDLKSHIVEFFKYVRGVDAGEIRTLTVQDGLPVSMEILARARGPEHERRESAG